MENAAKNHFRTAWELFRRHWLAFVLAQLIVVVAWVALEIAVVAAHSLDLPAVVYWSLWLGLHLAFGWVFCSLIAGIHHMALQAVDGGVPTIATALSCFNRGQTYLVAALLYWAAVLGGLVLCVIPGILTAVRWAPFRFVLADNSQAAVASLHEAATVSASNRWQVFRYLALSLALNLAGAAFLGVGLLATFPITVILRASHFRSLQQQLRSLPARAF